MEKCMNDMNIREPIPFTPAVVPAAYEDGLLKTADLNNPIAVEVEVWPAAETGYTVRLDLNGEPVTEERVIGESDKPGDVLTLHLAQSNLRNEGTYYLQYRAYSPNTGVQDWSPAIPLKVDRTPPGAALLAPLIVPNATFGNHLTALLPGYAGMEPGDTIQTLCNGQPGPNHIVQSDELTLRPIEIVFEREVMQGLAADNVAISYTVTDRAGNLSIESLPVTLSLNM